MVNVLSMSLKVVTSYPKLLLEQPDGLFYIIADANKELAMNTSEDKINHELEDGTLVKADTLVALAEN